MPIFNQDEQDSGDIFEQQRRRQRTNSTIDTARGGVGGATSPGAFVPKVRAPQKKPNMSAYGVKFDTQNRVRSSYHTSTGSIPSTRTPNPNPKVSKTSTQGYDAQGRLRRFDQSIRVGDRTIGFNNELAFNRAQRHISDRNKRVSEARARMKKMGYQEGSYFKLGKKDLSVGEKAIAFGKYLTYEEKLVRSAGRAVGAGLRKLVARGAPAAKKVAKGAGAVGQTAKRTARIATAPARTALRNPGATVAVGTGGIAAYGVTNARKPPAAYYSGTKSQSFGQGILAAGKKSLKEGNNE